MNKKPFTINLQVDLPIDKAWRLNHELVTKNLVKFLQSENLATPLSIALQGDWGSGKTSILKTLEKKLKTKNNHLVFFESWKYEYSNPTLGLVNKIISEMVEDKETIIKVLKLAANIFVRRFLQTDLDEIVNTIKESSEASQSLTKMLEESITQKLGDDKKLIIMIDDLDRCDVENCLMLLALVKLFLDIKNCICIAAVDFKRLEQAWSSKYGLGVDSKKEGQSYFDKIFQIKIVIPNPEKQNIKSYISSLVGKPFPEELLGIMAEFSQSNPRSIKRMLNLIVFRSTILEFRETDPHNTIAQTIATLWTLLEEMISGELTSLLYKQLGLRPFADCLVEGDWQTVYKKIEEKEDLLKILESKNAIEKLEKFFKKSKKVISEQKIPADEIVSCLSMMYSSTRILR